jgi:hypothetical protein
VHCDRLWTIDCSACFCFHFFTNLDCKKKS